MRNFLLFLMLTVPTFGICQQTIYDTIAHDNLQRAFILYVPDSYNPEVETPLIINFHGYTSTAFEQMNYGDFRPVSDTAGFLLVHPMGTLDNTGNTYWNANWGGDVDDVGFTEALIDSLSATYNIDQDKIYSTGMSNGGFMSYTLACELSHRIAAIASVTGTMVANSQNTCNPNPPLPVMEIHGTADFVVPYTGNAFMEPIPDVLDFWIDQNQCNVNPEITQMPDLDPNDGCTAEYQYFGNGINGATVEHFKIINGGHTWPGSIFSSGSGNTNQDINASVEIWKFFRKFDINGVITPTAIDAKNMTAAPLDVFPNPATGRITISMEDRTITGLLIRNLMGQVLLEVSVNHPQMSVDVSELPKGCYFIEAIGNSQKSLSPVKLVIK